MSVIAFPQSSTVVSEDVARSEFNRFVESMGLEFSTESMTEEERSSHEVLVHSVLRALMNGSLIIDEKGRPVFSPVTGGDPLTFHEPLGSALIAADQRKREQTTERTFLTIGEMTKQPPSRFAKMAIRDLKVCMAISTLFFTSK